MTTQPTPASELAKRADAWLDGGWRNDPPEEITLGKVMLMTAQSSRKRGKLHPELSKILDDNMLRKQIYAVEKVRAEQRALLAKRKKIRIY